MMNQSDKQSNMPVIHPNAAGIDIGAKFQVVAVGSDKATEPIRTFQSFTADLHEMKLWGNQHCYGVYQHLLDSCF